MNIQKYTEQAVATRSNLRDFTKEENILHCAIGCCTEAGELLDIVKRQMFYGKPMDRINLLEELGDILWYIANLTNIINATLEEVMDINIGKLRVRYPNKFTSYDALNRSIELEQETINNVAL